MAQPTPSRAQVLAEAYRRGLLPPARAAAYEEAARRGIVSDPYAAARLAERAGLGPAHGASLQLQSAIPGLPEVGAGLSATYGAVDNMLHGRPADFGGQWNAARATQAGLQDQFQADHPLATVGLKTAGLGAQVGAALASGGATELPAAADVARTGFMATARRGAAAVSRNAINGATIAAANAAAQPGTLRDRAQAADNAFIPGAAASVVIPGSLAALGKASQLIRGAVPEAVASAAPAAADLAQSEAAAPPRTVVNARSPQASAPATSTPGAASTAPSSGPAAAADVPRSVTSLTPVQESAVTKFVRAAKPDVGAMRDKANAFSGAGIAPTLVDTSGSRGQSIVRALATRPTAAQDVVNTFADTRALALPERIGQQVHDIVSTDSRGAGQIASDVDDARKLHMQQLLAPVRDDPVQVTPEMGNALYSTAAQNAIRDVAGRTSNPLTRDRLGQLVDHIKDNGVLDGANLTVGEGHDLSEALFSRANAAAADPAKAGDLKQLALAIRNGVKGQSPVYEQAMADGEIAHRLMEAPTIGAGGLSVNRNAFANQIAGVNDIPALPDDQGVTGDPQGNALARAGFREAIEKAAMDTRTGGAPGVARKIANVPWQQDRNAALLGPADATRLQDNLRLEAEAVQNASNANPRSNSATAMNLTSGAAINGEVDPGEAMGVVHSGLALAGGNPVPAAGEALKALLKQGRAFSDDEAEAFAKAAVDPALHDVLLQAIASRVGPQQAATFAPLMQDAAAAASTTPALIPAATAAANAFGSQNQPPGTGAP